MLIRIIMMVMIIMFLIQTKVKINSSNSFTGMGLLFTVSVGGQVSISRFWAAASRGDEVL